MLNLKKKIFFCTFKLSNPIHPLDFRKIYAKSNHILTVNMLEELNDKKPSVESAIQPSAINQVAILSPSQL